VVTGGGSSYEGLPERLKLEVEKIVHNNAPGLRVKVVAASTNERGVCTWIGGSILASIGAFHEMWISKQEYREFGASVVDRKCP
jgi:actin-related protein 4